MRTESVSPNEEEILNGPFDQKYSDSFSVDGADHNEFVEGDFKMPIYCGSAFLNAVRKNTVISLLTGTIYATRQLGNWKSKD